MICHCDPLGLLLLDTQPKVTRSTDRWYYIQLLNEKKTGQEHNYDLQFNRKIENNNLKELHPKQFRGLVELNELWVVHEHLCIAQVLNLGIYQKRKCPIVLVAWLGLNVKFVQYYKWKNAHSDLPSHIFKTLFYFPEFLILIYDEGLCRFLFLMLAIFV